jgi:hypothetical protein
MFSKVLGKNIFIVKTNVKLQKNDFIYLIFNVKMSIIYNKQNSALDESNLPTLIIWEVTWQLIFSLQVILLWNICLWHSLFNGERKDFKQSFEF